MISISVYALFQFDCYESRKESVSMCMCFFVRARFLYILEHVFIANGKRMSALTLNRLPVDLIESTKRRLPATINIDCAIFFCVLCGFVL